MFPLLLWLERRLVSLFRVLVLLATFDVSIRSRCQLQGNGLAVKNIELSFEFPYYGHIVTDLGASHFSACLIGLIPIPVANISSVEHSVNIGISDAYYVDKLRHYYGISCCTVTEHKLPNWANISHLLHAEDCAIQKEEQEQEREQESTSGLAPWLIAVFSACAIALCGPGRCFKKAPDRNENHSPTNSSVYNKVVF
ncbi:hypothetical protein pdam_00021680 [Pocillopora damicornis]|uniref:Uncharacterized protein n=1 Tax=Pocillopora damicornis TaxID=46731 RepID=A0A3M6UHI0_POCDA|nr:hypothetical protein pdam_00021680 [Pocillopora damicornis]